MTHDPWWRQYGPAVALLLVPSLALADPCKGAVNLRTGDAASCDGALVGPDTVRRIQALASCPADLEVCRSRLAAPLPQDCTPVLVHVPSPPVRVVVERQSWTAAVVTGALGLVVGAGVVLWLAGR